MRQYSVARTPQQNRVAERINRTLIEAARTMLADSKLPTTFWAEMVNTACYVQNRVLVVKPHNKTPYELFHCRTPALSFMRAFGCLVTILNTKDHLGKFDGKADEGFFEVDQIGFLDIDALTKSMNYKPVVVGNQSNGNVDQEKEDNVNNTNNVNAASTNGVNVVGVNTNNELPFDPEKPALEDISTFNFLNFVVYQMDVKSDFLYEKIKEEVYACQPLGFEDLEFLDKVGKIDKTLFIRRHKDDVLLVQVYVDDIIFGSTKKELCNAFEKMMHEKFQMSSMGELKFFLGLQVKQKQDGIFISQDKYVAEIIKKYGFLEVKNASTPMETQKPLLKDEDGKEVDVHMYRSMIGSLMYLTSSKPDIMFAVCAYARYHVNPKFLHLHAVKRIF
nr:hypothetical protein [Tanacetum cinerariifolium]